MKFEKRAMKLAGAIRLLAWGVALLAMAGAARAWAGALPTVQLEPPTAPAPARAAGTGQPESPDSAAALMRDRNPFRLARRPAEVRFGTEPPAPVAAPPDQPHPTLLLAGLVGGPPWTVLVEGVPGSEAGMLLFMGEDAGGIHIERIRGDTVFLTGLDTTWVLTPKRAW